MVRKMVLGALVLVAAFATPAAAQYNPFVVSPGDVLSGGLVNVQGSGCAPAEVVQITLTPASGGDAVVVATVTADENGSYSTSFEVPDGADLGAYAVSASCGNGVNGQQINVVPATIPPGSGTGGGGSLPRTGSDLNGLGLIGAGLLTAGGLVLVATKQRRHAQA